MDTDLWLSASLNLCDRDLCTADSDSSGREVAIIVATFLCRDERDHHGSSAAMLSSSSLLRLLEAGLRADDRQRASLYIAILLFDAARPALPMLDTMSADRGRIGGIVVVSVDDDDDNGAMCDGKKKKQEQDISGYFWGVVLPQLRLFWCIFRFLGDKYIL